MYVPELEVIHGPGLPTARKDAVVSETSGVTVLDRPGDELSDEERPGVTPYPPKPDPEPVAWILPESNLLPE